MRTWTQEEVEILIKNYNKATNSELAALLPSKSAEGIYKKAYKMGLRKSAEIEFKNRSEATRGEKSANWKGGVKCSKGYRQILMPNHHRADKHGYVMEHIVVFEKTTGVPVPPHCCVHHLNGNKADNRPENLCMMDHGAHTAFHSRGRAVSEEAKSIISQKAKERLSDKTKHPAYKAVDIEKMRVLRHNGVKVREICEIYGITKRTFYNKMEE